MIYRRFERLRKARSKAVRERTRKTGRSRVLEEFEEKEFRSRRNGKKRSQTNAEEYVSATTSRRSFAMSVVGTAAFVFPDDYVYCIRLANSKTTSDYDGGDSSSDRKCLKRLTSRIEMTITVNPTVTNLFSPGRFSRKNEYLSVWRYARESMGTSGYK